MFIHGGYFRALDKSQYRYIALPLTALGYTVALINYDLAPGVPVREIVRQVHASHEWILQNIRRWRGDPTRIVVCGHSVGAFLAARLLQHDWQHGSGIQKAVLLSGLYEFDLVQRSYLNRDLQLTDTDVQALAVVPTAMQERPDILVAVGDAETDEFVRQSRTFSDRLTAAGLENRFLALPRANHYSMSRLLARRRNPVMDWIAGR